MKWQNQKVFRNTANYYFVVDQMVTQVEVIHEK